MDRRRFIATGTALAGLSSLGARAVAQGASAVPDWLNALYRDAVENGETTVVYYPTGPGQEPLLEAFSQTFPDVELVFQYTLAAELSAILDTEIATGQRNIDICQGGPTLQLRLAGAGRQAHWALPEIVSHVVV